MRDFSSDSFKRLLSRYEHSKREGKLCYLDSDDYVDLSDYYLDIDKPHKALQVIDEGLLCHPDDELMPAVRAGVLIYLHRFDEAEAIVDNLSADDNYDVLYLQGQLEYAAHHAPDIANDYFTTWLKDVEAEWEDADEDEASPQEAESEIRNAYLHIVMSYAELGNTEREKWMRTWIEKYLKRFAVLGEFESDFGIADTCREEGYIDLVEEVFTRLLDTDPYLQSGWTILAAAQQSNEKYEEALNSLEFALAINPDDVPALLTKAHSYYALNNYADALPAFQKFRRLSGMHSEDQYIAFCYLNLNETALSVEYWKSAYQYVLKTEELDEDQRAWKFFEISDGLCMAEQYTLSLKAIDQALQLDEKNVDYNLQKGTVLLGLEETEKAVDVFGSLLNANPQHFHSLLFAIALRFLAYDLVEIAEVLFTSLSEMETTEEVFPQRNHIHAYLAMAHYQNGHTAEALASLKAACRLTPELVRHLFGEFLPDTVLPQDYYDYLHNLLSTRQGKKQRRRESSQP